VLYDLEGGGEEEDEERVPEDDVPLGGA